MFVRTRTSITFEVVGFSQTCQAIRVDGMLPMVKVKSRSYNDKRPCKCTVRRFTNEKPCCDPSGEVRETSEDYFCEAAHLNHRPIHRINSIGRGGDGWSGLEALAPRQCQVHQYRVAAVDLQLRSPGQWASSILHVASRIATSKLWAAMVQMSSSW